MYQKHVMDVIVFDGLEVFAILTPTGSGQQVQSIDPTYSDK